MRKAILFLVINLLGVISLAAQTATIDNPDLKVKVKNCIATGDDVYLDFVIINNSDNDIKDLDICCDLQSAAYDDEGNVYKGLSHGGNRKGNMNILNDNGSYMCRRRISIPGGVTIKCRLVMVGVPASATEFTRIDLNGYNCLFKKIKMKNIPIERD